jgi:hypothetical protein
MHLRCGWPLILIVVGGAIGGALGGAAYALNLQIDRSSMSTPAKVLFNLSTGLLAIILWLAIAVAIKTALGK